MADKRLENVKDKIIKSRDMLYSDIYYNDNLASEEIKRLRNRVNNAIEKISNNNIASTGVSNISILYTKTMNMQNKANMDMITELNKALGDRNTMNNIMALYTQNTLVRDLDKEIDMVCKYMPKLEEALDTRREHVLSADHFSKNCLNIKSVDGSNASASIKNNIETMRKKYNIEELFDNDIYRPTDKYGEAFVYIVPYKKAIEQLLQTKYTTNGTNNPDILNSPNGYIESVDIEAIQEAIEINSEEIDIKDIVHEAVNGYEDLTKKMKIDAKEAEIERQLMQEISSIKIEINRSRIIESAVKDRAKVKKVFSESGSLFFNENNDTSIFGNGMYKDKFYSATADPNSMSADGVTLLNKTNNKSTKITIPGCVVKVLDREMTKPLYIDNTCIGYFYIECDKKFVLEQTNYAATIGGIRPGGVYKGTFDYYRNTSNEYAAIKQIANMISQKIDAAFVNANQDLSKEIYSILKYNSTVDATGKISRIRITFIPPEDIEHCYFELDKETKRGISGLARSLFPAKLYSCLYISNTLLSITRGFDKRIYHVKQSVDTNVAGVLMNVINQIQRSNYNIRQIESMANVLNMIGRFNDYVIPRSPSGEDPIDFEVMPGQQVEIKSELMQMLEELAVNATDVPLELIQQRNQPDLATHLTMTNTKFLQKVYNRQSKTQKMFSRIATKIYNYEFNIDGNKFEEITVELPPPIFLASTNTTQIIDSVAQMSQIAGSAFTDEQAEPNKNAEFKRQFQQELITSLFPLGMIDKVMARTEHVLALKDKKDAPPDQQV